MSTVEVITAPTDWAAVVSAIVTGVAAVTGIAGTSIQARNAQKAASRDLARNLQAQADLLEASNTAVQNRSIYSQKLRVYAAFQGAIDLLIIMAERGELQEGDFSRAHFAMLGAAAEVELVAPQKIDDLAGKIKRSLSRGIGSEGFRIDFDPQRAKEDLKVLTNEMKSDLATYQPQPRHGIKLGPEHTEAAEKNASRRSRFRVTDQAL